MKTLLRICSTIGVLAMAGSAILCRAQSAINISFDSGVPSAFYDGGSPANSGGTITYAWQSTGGPDGSGCEVYNLDGTIDQEIDPAFNVSFTSGAYYQVTFQMKVDSSSGTINSGRGGYGHFQMALRDASYSWVSVGYQTLYPPAANGWVTYTFAIPSPSISVAHIQFQLQGGAAYSGPVTVYIGNLSVQPIPNPLVLAEFTNDTVSASWQNYGLNASWDASQDAPYNNPVTGAGPVSITPAGSVEFQATTPSGYPGGELQLGFNPSQFEWVGFDLYYDGPTPSTSTDFGGMQMMIANGSSPYNWAWIGGVSFTAAMVGHWTHFNLPCAASDIENAAGFAVQATPGSTAGATPITFHIDNIQTWNPVTRPSITGLSPATPGGVQISVDSDGTANQYDQEGISTPTTNNTSDFFWINQTPATYSFTLTNFPSPAAAPGFEAHIYIVNGDSIIAGPNDWSYNETYSGVPYNALDYAGLRIGNGTNGGVLAIFEWKTNAPSANATNISQFSLPSYTSANGTWSLNFSDNLHLSIVGPTGSVVGTVTLPDFYDDPNYTGNFSPANSMVEFGVAKHDVEGNGMNDGKSAIFTQVLTSNLNSTLSDNFSGPGLTANYDWQVAEYYTDSAVRAIWQPQGVAWWVKWNTAQSGWSVQSSSNLLNWGAAGMSYSYVDATGTNTLGAIPAASLPSASTGFFRLTQ